MNDAAENAAGQTAAPPDWSGIASSKSFKDLIAIKKTFIVPACCVFFVYFLCLPVLLGYAPGFAAKRVIGTVTVGYLFAISQFVVGWVIAALYLLAAARFDALAADILARVNDRQGGE